MDKPVEKPVEKPAEKPVDQVADPSKDFRASLKLLRSAAAMYRAFRDLDDVLTKAAEAEEWLKAAPAQQSDLERQVRTLIKDRNIATAESGEAQAELSRRRAEIAKAEMAFTEKHRLAEATHTERMATLEREYTTRSATVEEEYRTKDVTAQAAYDERKAKLEAEIVELERKVATLTSLRDQLKAV